MSTFTDLGPFLTVTEAAALLRLSRSAAYILARRSMETGGREGIPAVRIGRSIRIPSLALDRWANGLPFVSE
jgi:excisionase family DNA binding protein